MSISESQQGWCPRAQMVTPLLRCPPRREDTGLAFAMNSNVENLDRVSLRSSQGSEWEFTKRNVDSKHLQTETEAKAGRGWCGGPLGEEAEAVMQRGSGSGVEEEERKPRKAH